MDNNIEIYYLIVKSQYKLKTKKKISNLNLTIKWKQFFKQSF
jgi:hypothetical protein